MNESTIKNLHLNDELLTSFKLIEIGFGEFQNMDMENDFYHLPFQLLSSGFERLMKCHICFGAHEKTGKYPQFHELKKCGGCNGHDLGELKKTILANHFKTRGIPALKEDLCFLSDNTELDHLIYLLSEFGKFSRYHNLDVVTAHTNPSIDVMTRWKEYETEILTSDPDLLKKFEDMNFHREVINTIQRRIIVILEKFVRSISRQFTIGELGALALQNSPIYYPFIMLRDNELGTKNYRQKTTRYETKPRKPHKRNMGDVIRRIFNKNFVYQRIDKGEFSGDWPFYHEEVTIECRYDHWCIVTIEGTDYALNGAAQGKYKLEDVHDAGMAILGKSISPFIDMALNLKKKKCTTRAWILGNRPAIRSTSNPERVMLNGKI